MPKERKQRGRRNKKQDADDANVTVPVEEEVVGYHHDAQTYNDETGEHEQSANFFGLLDESEQTYFKTIDDAMIADEFTSVDERDIFVENVYREAEGKELKLATSPLGSKVLEQLLARSTSVQIRRLFTTYQGNFSTLVRQRYASHVCEMLFAIASTLVSSEMSTALTTEMVEGDEPYVSTESLFLYMFNEIAPDIANLGADVYASHVIRDLLLALDGTLFTFEEAKGRSKRYHGQKKFSWARPDRNLPVPQTFKDELRNVMVKLSSLPAAQLRMTAAQPYSVSFVQVLIAIEAGLSPDDPRPILFSLLGGEDFTERDDYMESILREPSGSKLCETIIASVPSSHFKQLHECYFKDRIAKFAQNPITNFVLQKLLNTCPDPATIMSIKQELVPIFKELIELNHMQVLQRLIEACLRTGADASDILNHVATALNCDSSNTASQLVPKLLTVPIPVAEGDRPPRRTADAGPAYNMQGAFLIKSLMDISPRSHEVVSTSLLETSEDILLAYPKSHASLKVLESFLSHPHTAMPDRKRLLNSYFTHFVALACDVTASRFVDLCWQATSGIKLYKDRIAQELVESADEVRGNYYGRIVWRNWNMDLYKNKRGEWNYLIKQAAAKESALAKLQQRHGAKPSPQIVPDKEGQLVEGMVNAERASLMASLPPVKKDKKKRKKKRDVVEDEVDDIFKKRKV